MSREVLEYDAVIVGGGPAGLSAAVRLRQLAAERGDDLSVCILEKGSEIGAHILSGAVVEPRALDELIPDWKSRGAPLTTAVSSERFALLTKRLSIPLPCPPDLRNHGNYVISLGNLCRWLGEQAEALGVEIYPGFPAAELLFDEHGAVLGVATADMGLQADGTPGPNHEPGVEIHATQTLFCEGCHGSLSQQLIKRFNLRGDGCPQTYGIGVKELWEVRAEQHLPGRVMHTIGWPLDTATYGGSFLYHLENRQVAIGYVIGLDYPNPYLSPFGALQQLKTHPKLRPIFEGGRRIGYGARALTEGGLQSLPQQLSFPGGALAGDNAGLLNVPKIKGSHLAMKSGMVAAESVYELVKGGKKGAKAEVRSAFDASWALQELRRSRNIRPSFRYGQWAGITYSAFDSYLFRGRAPWTLQHVHDHEQLKPADRCKKIDYPKPDQQLTFDRLSSVYLSNTNHAEEQPCHLVLRDPELPTRVNLAIYDGPEVHYCPAGVYEYEDDAQSGKPRLRINSQNCVHCKTCDIKDPRQNIEWRVPQGGDGPNYSNM